MLSNVLRAMREQAGGEQTSAGRMVLAYASNPDKVAKMEADPEAWNAVGNAQADLIRAVAEYARVLEENGPTIDSSSEDDLRKIAHRVGLELPEEYNEDDVVFHPDDESKQ